MSKKSAKAAKITKITAQSRPDHAAKPQGAQTQPKPEPEMTKAPEATTTDTKAAKTDDKEAKTDDKSTETTAKTDSKATVVVAKADLGVINHGAVTDPSDTPAATKKQKKQDKKSKSAAEKPLKEVFILARPFVALGRYLRDSWRELRQVRWPNRKATWKMTLAVLAYCAAFIVLVTLLDIFFTFIFNLVLGQ